jgi:hypothetical protein
MNIISSFLTDFKNTKDVHKPTILRLENLQDKSTFNTLFEDQKISFICDEIYAQLQELIKCKNPSIQIGEEEYPELIHRHLAGKEIYWMKKNLLKCEPTGTEIR